MKIILKKDVSKLGRAYDVLEVNEGYANNFLFPKGLAIKATAELIESSEKKKIEKKGKEILRHNLLEKAILELNGKSFEIKQKANEIGTLFSKIHKKEICQIIQNQTKLNLEEKMVILEKPIEKIGEYDISIFSEGVHSSIKLIVK